MTGLYECNKHLDFAELTDDRLIHMIHEGNNDAQEYIFHKYKNMVRIKSHEYFIVGADNEDIIQEGMIGLYKAIRDYKPDKSVPFYYFAQLCVTRQIITAIKAATRQKHMPLNAYISLNKTTGSDASEKAYIDMVAEKYISNPEELLIGKEGKNNIETYISEILSELECKVLYLHLKGKKYEEIAGLVSKNEKSIDNALQRVRHKIELYLSGNIDVKKPAKHKKKELTKKSSATK